MEDYARELVGDFIKFMCQKEEEFLPCHVTELLDEWVTSGNAIELTGGNHARFLRTAFIIVHQLIAKPEMFEGRAKQLSFRDEIEERDSVFLDPDYWDLWVFRRKYGERRDFRDPW
jgi:hypothetical protein